MIEEWPYKLPSDESAICHEVAEILKKRKKMVPDSEAMIRDSRRLGLWSNQLLYGESDLINDLTEHVKKQKEEYIMKFKNGSSYERMPSISSLTDISTISGITDQSMCIELGYATGQPVQLIVKGIPCTNEIDLIINSTKDGIEKILKILDAGCKNEKISEPVCINVEKVIFNNRTTIVLWTDGTKTKIRCNEKDKFDEETAVAICMVQKILGPGYKRTIRDILKTKSKHQKSKSKSKCHE